MPPPAIKRVAVITGASSGIGWELAKTLAAEGYAVGLTARRADRLNSLVEDIGQSGGVAVASAADVGDRSQVCSAIASIRSELGPIDLMVANAGVGVPTLLDPVNVRDVENMFQVNVLGMVYAIEAVLPEMLARRAGHIAGISSLASLRGLPGESGYCASKAAMNVYLEGLRIHVRDKGIFVTTVCPGFVLTPMTEINEFHMPWLLSAEAAAKRIARALQRRRKVYKFPWQTSLLMTATAWMPDWMVARIMSSYNEAPPMPKSNAT